MNKTELAEIIAEELELSKAKGLRAVDVMIESIIKAVKKGDDVTLIGFGTFKKVKRAARQARNPRTGAMMKIAAKCIPAFKAGKAFKEKVK